MKTLPRLSTHFGTVALGLSLLATACSGPQGEPGPKGDKGEPGTSATVDPRLSTLEKAYAGIGGKAALQALTTFELQATGYRFVRGEGYTPESGTLPANSFQSTLRYDLAGDRLSLQTSRTLFFFNSNLAQTYREVIRGNLGYLDGNEGLLSPAGGNLKSDRVAAIRRQQRLLNPHLLLKEVAAAPSRARDGGAQLLDGTVHNLLVLEDGIHPITLYVNATTGKISKLVTVENDPLHRDVPVELLYLGWEAAPQGGLLFPTDVYIAVDGEIVHTESRKAVTVNGTLDATTFELPASASPTYNAEDASRGERNHQFHMGFASIGIPLDGLQTTVAPVELAPGVFHLTGGSHNSLVIEQSNGLVLVEAPLNEERSEALLAWVKGRFPTKPITHVISSHFHDDHSAGLRTFVSEGAKVVVGEPSSRLFRDVFRAPSTIKPDALARKPTVARLDSVAVGGNYTVADTTRPVAAYHVNTTHAADMLMVYLPNEKLLFSADVYSPGIPGSPYPARELYKSITEVHKLTVERVAGAHGGVKDFSDLATLANQ